MEAWVIRQVIANTATRMFDSYFLESQQGWTLKTRAIDITVRTIADLVFTSFSRTAYEMLHQNRLALEVIQTALVQGAPYVIGKAFGYNKIKLTPSDLIWMAPAFVVHLFAQVLLKKHNEQRAAQEANHEDSHALTLKSISTIFSEFVYGKLTGVNPHVTSAVRALVNLLKSTGDSDTIEGKFRSYVIPYFLAAIAAKIFNNLCTNFVTGKPTLLSFSYNEALKSLPVSGKTAGVAAAALLSLATAWAISNVEW